MIYGLYVSAEGALAQSTRMEAIANNLANVSTPGFRRDLALMQARLSEAVERGYDQAGSGSINDLGGGVMVEGVATEHAGGPLAATGIATDMAIRGDGFFVVDRDGEEMLTRAGNFQLTSRGMLVTGDGYPVLSESRAPIVVDPEQGAWELTPEGQIRQAGTIQALAIVRPESLGDLAKRGENLYAPLGPTRAVPPGERQVAGGFLEQSGVRPTLEMMEMIETSRAFEANVNLLRTQDQLLSTLLSRVLRS